MKSNSREREGVVRERGVLRAADDVVRRVALALEQEVGLADGVGLGVDLLAVEVGGDLLAVLLRRAAAASPRRRSACRRCRRRRRRAGRCRTRSGRRSGRNMSCAMSFTASRGVQCSPASSLFSSLKRRTSSSKMVPIAWLSRPGCFTEPSPFSTGSGLRLMSGSRNFSMSVAEGVGLGEPRDLVAELEVLEDVLHVRREAVEVGHEVGLQLSAGWRGT